MTKPVVDLLATQWAALTDLCASLTPDEWDLDTDCPGWTVRDNLADIIGTERSLLGDPTPAFAGEKPAHVKNFIGESNEPWVDSYRGLPGDQVLEAFRSTTARRLEAFAAMTDEEWAAEMPGPTGVVPYSEFMNIRLMDAWVHDQDIRRAVGRPGNQTGTVADHSLARFVPAMGFVVGKKAGATDGQSVRFDLTGEQARRIGVAVVDGRAQVSDDVDAPTTTLTMGAETWWCLALGRRAGDAALADGQVQISGDQALGEAVVHNLAFMI